MTKREVGSEQANTPSPTDIADKKKKSHPGISGMALLYLICATSPLLANNTLGSRAFGGLKEQGVNPCRQVRKIQVVLVL